MSQTYYSPFFPDPTVGGGSKGSTIPIVTPTEIDVIQNNMDFLLDGGFLDDTPPGAPTGLALSSTLQLDTDGTQFVTVTATWDTAPEADAARFDLAIKEDSGSFIPTTVGIDITSYKWNVLANHLYTVKLRCVDKAGNLGAYCTQVSITSAKDNIAPAVPTGLTGSAAFQNAFLAWTNANDSDLAFVEIYHNTTNSSGSATLLATIAASPSALSTYIHTGLTNSTTHYYWLKSVDTSDNKSGFSTGSGAITTAGLGTGDFAIGLAPNAYGITLPSPIGYTGAALFYNTTDKQLYRYNATTVAWTVEVPAVNITGQIVGSQITDTILTAAKFAASIKPVELFATFAGFPAAGTNGRQAYAQDTKKTYRDTGTAWIATIDATDLTGQIVSTQITDGSITTPKMTANSISGDRITAGTLDASKISADSITAGQIAAGAIGVSELAANSVTATAIAANSVTTVSMTANSITGDRISAGTLDASKITAASITATQIATGTITTNLITAGAITTSLIAASAITATQLAAGSVTTAAITVNTLNGDRIQTGTLNADRITASSIFSNTLYVGSATTDNQLSTIATRSTDPATRINAYSTLINPGMILIAGSTTLSDWRNGTDTTKIEGGAIYANTINANSLKIGSRGITFQDTYFQTTGGNTCTWTAGAAFYYDDSNNLQVVGIAAGSCGSPPGGFYYYIYWTKGATSLSFTTTYATAMASNAVHVATYTGGTQVVQLYGGTIIDGSNITTGTITATKLAVSSLSAITATIGTLRTATSGARLEISDNVIKVFDSSGTKRVQLGDLSL